MIGQTDRQRLTSVDADAKPKICTFHPDSLATEAKYRLIGCFLMLRLGRMVAAAAFFKDWKLIVSRNIQSVHLFCRSIVVRHCVPLCRPSSLQFD